MRSIDTLTRRIKIALRSHPEIQARLSGIVRSLVGDSSAAREIVNKHVAGVEQLGILARNCLYLGIGDKARSLGPNANIPDMIFTSSLLNFCRFELSLPIKNWVDDDRDSASATTGFVRACFCVAGFPPTFDAVKKRIARALKTMDRNEAAGLEWNVLKVGSPATNSKRP